MSLTADADDTLPDEKHLPRPRIKAALLTLVSALFTAGGVLMVRDGEAMGWPVAGFFGLCAIVGISTFFGNQGVSLYRDGFTVRTLFMTKRYEWKNVSVFEATHIGRTAMLVFDELDKPTSALREMNRSLAGGSAAIPLLLISGSLEDACALMNEFRARAVHRS